jgi:hypothetical protein
MGHLWRSPGAPAVQLFGNHSNGAGHYGLWAPAEISSIPRPGATARRRRPKPGVRQRAAGRNAWDDRGDPGAQRVVLVIDGSPWVAATDAGEALAMRRPVAKDYPNGHERPSSSAA